MMVKILKFGILLVLVGNALTNRILAQSISSIFIDQSKGLYSEHLYTSIQDKKGFYWFCSRNGVFKYDGKKSTRYSMEDGLGDNTNFTILEDSKGGIWFGGFNGTISYIIDGKIFNSNKDNWLIPDHKHAKIDVLWESEGYVCFKRGRKNFLHVKLADNVEDYQFSTPYHIKDGVAHFTTGDENIIFSRFSIVRAPSEGKRDSIFIDDGSGLVGFRYINNDSIFFFDESDRKQG